MKKGNNERNKTAKSRKNRIVLREKKVYGNIGRRHYQTSRDERKIGKDCLAVPLV